VETAQRTLEGEDERAAQEDSIRELVLNKTQQLQVNYYHNAMIFNMWLKPGSEYYVSVVLQMEVIHFFNGLDAGFNFFLFQHQAHWKI